MTRPTVATVLSPRPWEEVFAAVARHSALVRLVGRVYEPIDLHAMPRPDWVVVGAETAWLGPDWVKAVHRGGSAVLGIVEGEGEAERLEAMGIDAVASAATDPFVLFERLLLPTRLERAGPGTVVGVLGPPGAGATTVAIAIAGDGDDTAIVDTDVVPGVGPTLGMAPPGSIEVGDLVVPGSARPDGACVLTVGGLDDPTSVVHAAAGHFDRVVVDAAEGFLARIGWCATELVLVVDASVQGILRAIALIERWEWPPPRLVLNRVTDAPEATEAARASLGLEPDACVPITTDPLSAARSVLTPQSAGRLAAR